MANADSFYTIGHGHKVCQDYALSFNTYENNPAIVVCDGCSSAKNSEVGAAILAHTMKKWSRTTSADNRSSAMMYCRDVVKNISAELELPSESFFSTVMYAEYEKGDGFYVDSFGDGVIIGIRKDGGITYTTREFKSGAPFYMAYLFDKETEKSYSQTFGTESIITTHTITEKGEDFNPFISNQFSIFRSWFSTLFSESDYDAVILCTDGILSFQPELSTASIARNLTEFKNKNGQFIERRLKRFLSTMNETGFKHFDDIGVGGITL